MKLSTNKMVSVALISASLLLSAGCKKVLDVAPYSSLPEATSYNSPERVEAAMNGVYDAAQTGFYPGGTRGYPFGAASIEQSEMRGEDMLTFVTFYQFTYESGINTTTANNVNMFENLYSLINKANLTIDGVTKAASQGIISNAAGIEYAAECRFLRALAHHELLMHFSRPYRDGNGTAQGIVYRDFAINTEATVALALAQTRTTVADNYTKILADLDFAETNLPATTSAAPAPINAAANKTYRTTKAAAIALKMRVRLHMGDWPNVIAEGLKIVPATPSLTSYPGFVSPIGGWKLELAPNVPFTTGGWQGNENMFSIRNAATDNNGPNGALAQMMGNTSIGGRGIIRISPILYNLPAFGCTDLRRNMMSTIGAGAAANYVTTKYIDPTTNTDPAPMMRYAEVLLVLAEAEARQNGITPKALQLLNEVRNRSLPGGPGTFTAPPAGTYTAASFLTTNALVKAILDERRIEFVGEGKRWPDIHRNATDAAFTTGGIPAKIGIGISVFSHYVCGAGSAPYASALTVAQFPYSDYRFLWPIPLSERQVNPNFAQNPTW